MTIIATEGQFSRFGSLVKWMDAPEKPELHYEVVTANEAAGATYTLGTVLGQVTATGKYVIAKQGAADGSQTPCAVVLADAFGAVKDQVLNAGTDTKALVLARGKVEVAREALKLDASFGTAAQIATALAGLTAKNILIVSSL